MDASNVQCTLPGLAVMPTPAINAKETITVTKNGVTGSTDVFYCMFIFCSIFFCSFLVLKSTPVCVPARILIVVQFSLL